MDREIKFRGKQLNGEWAYGDLLRIGGGCIIYIGSKTEIQTPDIPKESDVAVELFDNDIAIVIPSTVGQFTGLTDCNGREIYEGDIVKFDCGLEATISYSQIDAAFMFNYRDGFPMPISVMYVISEPALFDAEVIGNIHDNPELIPNQPTAI